MTKAQGLSMTTIIIAAICLIVLIVIIVIFTGNINDWSSNVKSCAVRGGKACRSDPCGPSETEIPNVCEDNQYCCIEILDNAEEDSDYIGDAPNPGYIPPGGTLTA